MTCRSPGNNVTIRVISNDVATSASRATRCARSCLPSGSPTHAVCSSATYCQTQNECVVALTLPCPKGNRSTQAQAAQFVDITLWYGK
ncbi:hypothetical protein BgiBS90_028953 [Biomphalaria glabrata]|nr:hypothetical protein BgiBS90_028953 [Biomphalaria glabrata]